MKKIIALFLALVLCVGLVACGSPATPSESPSVSTEPTPAPSSPAPVVEDTLGDALAYIKTVYKNAAEITSKDFERIGTVPVGTERYEVVWTVDVSEDLVKIVKTEAGMVLVDVNEGSTEEVPYVLTATITNADGKSESLSWNHILPASMDVDGMTYAEIVDMVYALEDQAATEDPFRLYGTITSIDTPWSEDYQNITVTIVVAGKEEQPIQCYRLKGDGAADLAVGDDITVEGILKNYKGTYEFDAGCILIGHGEHVDQKALLKAAFALGEGAAMDYPAVLTGVVSEIPTAWSDEYGNITVNMDFDGQIVQCYRLSGEGAKDIQVGDTITVAGIIKNYKGLIEFDQGCKLVPNDMYHSVKNALSGYKLLDGEAQEVSKTITGTIINIDTPWSEDYQNITVTIVVAGLENYPIMCYRLSGEGAKDLAVGQTITVTGTLKNYKGTIEFDAGCTLGGSQPVVAPVTPDVKPEPSPEPKPSTEPQPSPEPKPSTEPQPSPEPTPSTEPQPSPEPTPSTEPQPSPEPTPSTEPQPSPEPTPSTEPQPSPKPTPSTEPQPSPEPSPEPSTEPEPAPANKQMKIYYPDGKLYVTANPADRNRLARGTEAEATVWTVEIDENGYYIFSYEGKYMTSGKTGNSLSMNDTLTEFARWEVIECDGGVYLRNVGANYNGKYNQYMEFYYDFTTYGFKESSAKIYTFQLIEVK